MTSRSFTNTNGDLFDASSEEAPGASMGAGSADAGGADVGAADGGAADDGAADDGAADGGAADGGAADGGASGDSGSDAGGSHAGGSNAGGGDDHPLLRVLNPPQRAAVEQTEGPVLILAGAGSGKTRVLTHRIAWLVRECGVPPHEVLAFTFTNKAAAEMRERVRHLLEGQALAGGRITAAGLNGMWVGTFHSTCVRILRQAGERIGLPDGFSIYDTDDQQAVVKKVLVDLNLGDDHFRPRQLLSKISGFKNQLTTPEMVRAAQQTFHDENIAKIYAGYQKELRRARALDFDDLIGETVRLFDEHADVRAKYAGRFRYVHVDEYQDTNVPQYRLITQLASVHRNLCVVGDDDQSIYGWRGADIENILSFEEQFADAFVVRLEQNYRSTAVILAAANAVVRNNRNRKEKTLWTDQAGGEKLRFTLVGDEEEEGQLVVEGLTRAVHRQGRSLKDVAVLYRTNAQSRALENALRRAAIPYELVGGVPFYQRREVKDLLAYLRLAVNTADDLALRRVLNVPKRGIGKTTLDRLLAFGFREGISLLDAARRANEDPDIKAPTRTKIVAFAQAIQGLTNRLAEPVAPVLMDLIKALDYEAYLREDDPETAADRIENIHELVVGARQFAERSPDASVGAFLNEVALLTDADRIDESAEKVRLMTAHNAKGLEFDLVFLAGLEEGLMPHASSTMEESGVEEERRLFYVALTRAREEIQLSAASERRRFGVGGPTGLSRFLNEIPAELMEVEERPRSGYSRPAPGVGRSDGARTGSWGGRGWGGGAPARQKGAPAASAPPKGPRLSLGRIIHPTFGRGEVVAQDGTGPEARLSVQFENGVMKKIVAKYAQWEESNVDF